MAISSTDRKKAETLIYKVMNELDPSGTNTEHYKKIFSKMSDKQFEDLFKKKFPLKFYTKPFEIEPGIDKIENAAKVLNIPLLEKVNLPYVYVNEKGEPVQSKECLVGYVHLRKVQQFVTKKNSMSTDITSRDMKTGLLINYDKNGKTSDREAEAMIAIGLDKTVDEFIGARGDNMEAKNIMYNIINSTGSVSIKDLPKNPEESLSINLFNTYMIGAHLNSNILNKDYLLPHTLKNNKEIISRA